MSENELDKTLAHAIQPHDKVHRATSPQQLQSQFPNLEAAVHYQSNIDPNPAGIRQNYYRIPRNFQPPQSTTNKDGPRVCTSLPLYLTKVFRISNIIELTISTGFDTEETSGPPLECNIGHRMRQPIFVSRHCRQDAPRCVSSSACRKKLLLLRPAAADGLLMSFKLR
ncbi:ABC transporter ATP-binding protein [Anopheles sinensis]|uniref:ABC transporter ATP-binding protein n=1 Tax=Anopheles sinensis TaxID=74873 RepID=A0A084WFQ4_ANOSI|nr:ABC transporter ATP-binding protein [Anopheles sinensis]